VKAKIDKFLGNFLVGIMTIMVFDVLWQIFSRYVLNDPSSFTDELARILLIWIGILGAAYASGQKMHLSIDLLSDKLSSGNALLLHHLKHIIIATFSFFALVIGGSRLVYITYVLGQDTPAMGIPMSLVYTVLPISGLLIIIYKIMAIKSAS
jgi:TRAP-type C4-dicarboxylate transport system permease small subunit